MRSGFFDGYAVEDSFFYWEDILIFIFDHMQQIIYLLHYYRDDRSFLRYYF